MDKNADSRDNFWIRIAKRYHRVLKFAVVGISGIPVNLFFVWLGKVELFTGFSQGWSDGMAYLLGIVVSIFTNFLLNYWWTWRDRRGKGGFRNFFRKMGMFYVVSAAAAVIQYVVTMGASAWLKGYVSMRVTLSGEYRVYNLVAPTIGIAVAFIVNYLVNNYWTFKAEQ